MSYCRFMDGDVYAYETEGGVQFWVSGDNKALDRLCNTFNEAYRYIKELRDVHGLDVPSYAIEALKEDALEEAKRISGASGVIGELQAENAKLRELAAGVGHLLFSLDVDYCAACPRDSINHPCPVYAVNGGECLYKADLRELGIEALDV